MMAMNYFCLIRLHFVFCFFLSLLYYIQTIPPVISNQSRHIIILILTPWSDVEECSVALACRVEERRNIQISFQAKYNTGISGVTTGESLIAPWRLWTVDS